MNQSEKIKQKVISDEALFQSMMKCKKGVLYKSSVSYFYLHCMDEITKLADELESGTYTARKPKKFEITSPKRRDIVSIAFRDRVFQRSLNDNVVYPMMTKSFIYDNAACQIGKGTDFARERFKTFLQRHYRKHGTEGYVLKIDIKKYYDSIDHEYAKKVFRSKLDDWSYEQVVTIIDTQYAREKGFSAGSQVIQILGISAMDCIDHAAKEELHLKEYIRYQDDFVSLEVDKGYLEYCKGVIETKLSDIGFQCHPKKTQIIPITEKIRFLGWDYRLTKTGKVIMSIAPEKVKFERRHLKKMVQKCKKGELPRSIVDEHFDCEMRYFARGNSHKLIAKMKDYYKKLWEEDSNEP